MATLLTGDDLTEFAYDADRARDVRPFIAELVAVADEGRLVDEADASYAPGLASDLTERLGDGDEAIALSRRALEKGRGSPDENWLRGQLADLLLRWEYDDEGMRAAIGSTWDEHRPGIEPVLQEEGSLLVEVATPELLRANLAGEDIETIEAGPLLEWPPGRKDPYWCGSRTEYKKCCLPRTRS